MGKLSVIEPENPAEDVIATLERVLELAHEGRLSSVAVAMVQRDGVGHHIWSTIPQPLAMVGAVDRLKHFLNLYLDDVGTGTPPAV